MFKTSLYLSVNSSNLTHDFIHLLGTLFNRCYLDAAAAAAKSLQSCPTLCDPIDCSPPGSPVPGILQARTLEWVAISFSNAWKWKVKVKSLSRVQLPATPWTAANQAPLSVGFSRQEYLDARLYQSRCEAQQFFNLPTPIHQSSVMQSIYDKWTINENLTIDISPHTLAKQWLKILQARLQQYVNCEFPDVQASRKTSISALSTMPKILTV